MQTTLDLSHEKMEGTVLLLVTEKYEELNPHC
jgi:hypothetical protein